MENEKEKKYFIIWLYISILLHLFVVIIMLSIKPTSSPSKDPDPASNYETQVIFIQDQPITAPIEPTTQQEPQVADYQIATRIQGGAAISLEQNKIDQKETSDFTQSSTKDDLKQAKVSIDKPEAALSNEYKKGMHNRTKTEDQSIDGNVNILEDAIIDEYEQLKKQIMPPAEMIPQSSRSQIEEPLVKTPNELTRFIESQEKRIASVEALKTIISKSTQTINTEKNNSEIEKIDPIEETPQLELQKVASKKHRPADIGQENLSKVQLSKESHEIVPKKNKMSLLDIQQGFSEFIKNSSTKQIATPRSSTLGNSLYFSSTGNAQKDDELGLKLASYLNQTGKMYDNACSLYSDSIIKSLRQQGLPSKNNKISIKIERSGKISEIKTVQSCGNETIDNYHVQIIEAMGDLPPIPKYIEAPLQVGASFNFKK